MTRVVFIVLAGALFPCSQSIEPPKLKPQMSLTVQSTTVIGASIKGAVTASGCSKTRVDVLGADQSFILDTNFAGNPTPWELDFPSLGRFYPAGGLALHVPRHRGGSRGCGWATISSDPCRTSATVSSGARHRGDYSG